MRSIMMLILVISSQVLSGQQRSTPETIELDNFIRDLMPKAGVTGLSVGIITGNEVSYLKSYGYKNKSNGALNDEHTSFYAASLAKSLFATLVMQLVDEGLIDLDIPLYTYLPKPLPTYENYKDLANDDRWKLITARHCLSHTTGFPNWRQLNPRGNKKLEIFFSPGTKYAYSGEGIYLLQLIVETITGKGLEELAQEKIFKPCGMIETSFVWQKAFFSNYAYGHDRSENPVAPAKRTEANAAGSMQTTIGDYTRFMAAVMQGKCMSKKSEQEMFSPQIRINSAFQFPTLSGDTTNENDGIELSYGLGWGLFKSSLGNAFFKEGHSDDGWQHYVIGFPGNKSSVVLLSNSSNAESVFREIIEKLTDVTIPWKWERYMPYRPAILVPEKILSTYAGNYTGKFNVNISVVDGKLLAESKTAGLPPTPLYAQNEKLFFMRSAEIDVLFVKNTDGLVQKIIVEDEGEKFDLTKVSESKTGNQSFEPSGEIRGDYKGTYHLKDHPEKTIVIEDKKGVLSARISGQGSLKLIFVNNKTFSLENVSDAKGEFILENGKAVKFIIEQGGRFEWLKTK